MRTKIATLAAALACAALAGEAQAWDRGRVETFAVLPAGSGGPEGLEVDPHGNVYVGSFGFTAEGPIAAPPNGRVFVLDRHGKLLRTLQVANSSPNLLGLRWRRHTGTLLVVDFGRSQVLDVDPVSGASTVFLTIPAPAPPAAASLNDVTFDRAGNVYVSDSFQGIVWRTGKDGGLAEAWVESELLRTTGVPPFGANGLRFDRDETALFVANTGNDTVIRIPVANGAPGAPAVFVNSVNGADGLLIDRHDNLWIAANQADEIVVLDPSGKAIAKLGDFDGVRRGGPEGLLFPASLRFAGDDDLLVTNLALDLRLFDPAFVTPDSAWAAKVERYTVSRVRLDREGEGRGRGGEHDGREDGRSR
jgi:sugar lactone lactonase YvrE